MQNSAMTDYIDWPQKLMHIRFQSALLFLEKWMTVTVLMLFYIHGFPWPVIIVLSSIWVLNYFWSWSKHVRLQEAAGLPVGRLLIKY